MDFQVNGETYFVTLGEDPGEWQVFVSTPEGTRSIPVYEDVSESDEIHLVIEDNQRRRIVN
jgi:hypothetical protein